MLNKLRMRTLFLLICFFLSTLLLPAQEKYLPAVPSAAQLQWHNMEFYLFVHFGPNTFTDLEWGKGSEKAEVFDPEKLDCEQWCRIAKASGAKGIIITAKHHDGFCLWPSKYSTHTVAQSKWKNGKGDVLKELSAACKKYDLKFGVYLSPWDRNHPLYGTEEYNDVYINMMKEVVSNYGPLFEFWWDGANGEGPNGKKQVYDWKRFESTLRNIAPHTLIFSDIGPDIRWVGNEQGFASATNWNLLDTAGFTRGAGSPPTDTLATGNMFGKNWIPAECDVSIRPGWFYHDNENGKVKSPEELFSLYLKSVGRGANLLLNVPPDRNGLISSYDSVALAGLKGYIDKSFGQDLTANESHHYYDKNDRIANGELAGVQIDFFNKKLINCMLLGESLEKGQQVSSFTIELYCKDSIVKKIEGTTIGHKRILVFPETAVESIRVKIKEAKGRPVISEV
jgi:alpha-L-fucosidase